MESPARSLSPPPSLRAAIFTCGVPRVATARLRLREPRLDDFEAFAANAADPRARAYVGGPLSRRDAWRRFLSIAGTWVVQGHGWWTIEEHEHGAVGSVGVFRRETGPELEIGWNVLRPFWGRGYASEAAKAALDYALNDLQASRVIAIVAPDNVRSHAVAQRIGMRREGEKDDVELGRFCLYAAGAPAA